MIFFEGFSSLIPYVIYLTLIWICLIFGFKGQLVASVHALPTQNHESKDFKSDQYTFKTVRYLSHVKAEYVSYYVINYKQTWGAAILFFGNSIALYPEDVGLSLASFRYNPLSHRGPPSFTV